MRREQRIPVYATLEVSELNEQAIRNFSNEHRGKTRNHDVDPMPCMSLVSTLEKLGSWGT